MRKLELLKEYCDVQANDDGLWLPDLRTPVEAYLQQELRRIAFLIEEASEEEIRQTIVNYKERL